MTQPELEKLAASLSEAQRRNIVKTPHPQPMEDHWLWAGSVLDAIECSKLGLMDKDGFTETGLALRNHLKEQDQ